MTYVRPWHARPWPMHEVPVFALAALLYPAGRKRARERAIGPVAFSSEPASAMAAALLGERDFTSEEIDLMWHDDGVHAPLAFVVDIPSMDEAWAARAIDIYADAYAYLWVPQFLRWLAARCQIGKLDLATIAPEVQEIMQLAGAA